MLILTTIMSMIFIITNLIMILASMISKKSIYDREKMSPFECGFEPFNSSRLPFSLRFFLIALMFLIFDIEIILMLPMIFSMKINSLNNWTFTISSLITILIMGLLHEWNEGALEWSN